MKINITNISQQFLCCLRLFVSSWIKGVLTSIFDNFELATFETVELELYLFVILLPIFHELLIPLFFNFIKL